MKLFRSDQIKLIDDHTINVEPIASIDLMERAAGMLLRWYLQMFERSKRLFIFAGPGNNGGDGLALARLLETYRYEPEVYYVEFTGKTSEDWKKNLYRLKTETKVPVHTMSGDDQFPSVSADDIIIDAIFGSGLSHPVEGLARDVIKHINSIEATVVSIDIPSGMFCEDNTRNDYSAIVSADYTLSFEFPKLSFMFAENAEYLGKWIMLPIGLSAEVIRETSSPYLFLEKNDIVPLLKKRNKFDHKGIFGHGLLYAGSYGKMGAAILGAEAALRSGIGLITCHVPSCGISVIQSALPEAMADPDRNEKYLSEISGVGSFSATGIGPGIGKEHETQKTLYKLLTLKNRPIVIDADALNILSLNQNWYSFIPEGAILTPHPKEFERLTGKSGNSFIRLNKQINFSAEYKCIVVLKGAHTSITTPDGKVYFNSTGNPGMATAGSGDVLTGIILSLLAQGYYAETAAVLGVYIHGLAGDIAAEESCYESIIASDIINSLAKAFCRIRNGMNLEGEKGLRE